jgi:hypothetical protein
VWHSSITRIQPNKVAVRGYDIAELMGRLLWGGGLDFNRELPSPAVARLMDAILVSSIDHGATPIECAQRCVYRCDIKRLSPPVSCRSITHGGAIEDCARQLKAMSTRGARRYFFEAQRPAPSHNERAGERMSGFGHRVHTKVACAFVRTCQRLGGRCAHAAARAVESICRAKKSLPSMWTARLAPFSLTWE